jgi:hypothetical protein
MQNITNNKWAATIANRITDEWSGKNDFPEDADLLRDVLNKLLVENPDQCKRLVGTGIIEENYFTEID